MELLKEFLSGALFLAAICVISHSIGYWMWRGISSAMRTRPIKVSNFTEIIARRISS